MALRSVQFLAIVLTALALVPAGAHFFELPGKMLLERDAYLAVQGIYAGWALFGIVYFGALLSNLALAFMRRRQRGPFLLALVGVLAMGVFFAVFLGWTVPANQV